MTFFEMMLQNLFLTQGKCRTSVKTVQKIIMRQINTLIITYKHDVLYYYNFKAKK